MAQRALPSAATVVAAARDRASASASSATDPPSPVLDSNDHPVAALRKYKPYSPFTYHTMDAWRKYRDHTRRTVLQTYKILGFLSSGTYGRVYKACLRQPDEGTATTYRSTVPGTKKAKDDDADGGVYAIKKFKPDKDDGGLPSYTGISQSAMREIALNRELRHENIVTLKEVMLEDRAIYMVFAYASHDFLQVIHHHSTVLRAPIPGAVLKSLLFQLLCGVHYLHSNWVLHRDLKPANILLTSSGVVKIGDLGLARLYSQPLQPLYHGDKVVVTIWYRAPELLMGARHYTPAIDMWAIGCIWGELLGLRPLFKGEEAKADPKTKGPALQLDQMTKIVEVLGNPTKARWPKGEYMPDWAGYWQAMRLGVDQRPNVLLQWYHSRSRSTAGFDLFESLLQYDPGKRMTAEEALKHAWFREDPVPTRNAFSSLAGTNVAYPSRRLHSDTTDPVMAVDPSQVAGPPPFAAATAAGGTAMPLPGPSAPAPAPPSGGSLPNSVGASHSLASVGAGLLGTSGGPVPPQSGRGGMVATAAANATAQAQAQAQQQQLQQAAKRPRLA
ncbi:unnamed protein product [Parajaminaea phylloscopi]